MMHYAPSKNTSLSRALLAGLACGILAAILNLLYSYFYRKATTFTDAGLFEPLLVFVGFPLLFIVIAVIFYEMVEYIKKGGLIFTCVFLLIMAAAIILSLSQYEKGMEGFLLGIILITGLLIALLLPYLATHAKIFMDKEEFIESTET
jgi:hypothetical protein